MTCRKIKAHYNRLIPSSWSKMRSLLLLTQRSQAVFNPGRMMQISKHQDHDACIIVGEDAST